MVLAARFECDHSFAILGVLMAERLCSWIVPYFCFSKFVGHGALSLYLMVKLWWILWLDEDCM